MPKSSKRIRLEKEIFSKSIKDIEKMFHFACDDDEPVQRKMPSHSSSPSAGFSRLDVPAGTLRFTRFDYDCINPNLIRSDTSSEPPEPARVPVLPLSSMPCSHPLLPARSVLLDLNDDDDVDDYMFELDLKQYMPRINLEKDLKMIETMLSRPMHIRS